MRLKEGAVKNICGRLDVRGVRIPLGDQPLGKGHLDRNGFFARIIEIKDWSFHPHSAAQTELEAVVTKVFHETGQVRGAREWRSEERRVGKECRSRVET